MPLERLEILLAPGLLVSRRLPVLGSRDASNNAVAQAVDMTETGAGWGPAVAALRNLLMRESGYGTRVDVALSDLWVRFHLVLAIPRDLAAGEMLLMARAHFGRQYPDASLESWTFRLARQDSRLLVAAMESKLPEAIRTAHVGLGARLRRVEPLFSWVYDRFEKVLADTTGWLLLDEPGLLTLACLERGRLTSLHNQRCENDQDEVATRLLERQSALGAHQSTEVHVFSVDARIVHLPSPWRIVRQQRVFEPVKGTDRTPLPVPLSRQH